MSGGPNASEEKAKALNIFSLTIPRVKFDKLVIINFLNEIYSNINKRAFRVFNSYTFQEIIKIPIIISDKIFSVLSDRSKRLMTQNQFSYGIYSLLYHGFETRIALTFEIFDFDNDDVVKYEDVVLLLTHFHLIDNSYEKLGSLEKLIKGFFGNDQEISKIVFMSRCKNQNADPSILFIIFINKYVKLFQRKELTFFSRVREFSPSTDEQANYTSFDQIRLSRNLIEYAECIDLKFDDNPDDDNFDFEEYFLNDDIEGIKDLNNFEKDVGSVFARMNQNSRIITQRTFSPGKSIATKTFLKQSSNVKTFQSVKTANDRHNILKLPTTTDNYASNKSGNGVRESPKSKSNMLRNSTFCSSNQDDGTFSNISPYTSNFKHLFTNKGTTEHLSSFFRASPIDSPRENVKSVDEILLYKATLNMECSELIKLVLINGYIFYFKKGELSYTFKKLIPLISLFPQKYLVNKAIMQLILKSTLRNTQKKYIFLGENIAEIEHFVRLVNKECQRTPISEDYKFKYELGKGKFGHVILAESREKPDNQGGENEKSEVGRKLYAIKIVNKNNSTEEEYKINRWEANLFCMLRNVSDPNIVTCYRMYETDQNLFFVYGYVEGSDLKTYIRVSSKADVADLSIQIIKGLYTLTKLGIIHRDIKTTNILVETNTGIPKIIDFGLSRVLGNFETSTDPYGSLCFKAPELLKRQPYNFKADVWSFGITLYFMLFKQLPFETGSKNQIKNSIINDPLDFPNDSGNNPQTNKYPWLLSLVAECLTKDPKLRPSMAKLMTKYAEEK